MLAKFFTAVILSAYIGPPSSQVPLDIGRKLKVHKLNIRPVSRGYMFKVCNKRH